MTLLVGFRGGVDDRSGLELAATLARSAGQALDVVTVVPSSWPTPVAGAADRDFARWSAQQGASSVQEAETLIAELCPDLTATARSITSRSVATGLLELAKASDVATIVIGSTAEVGHGQINVGSTASRLLHSSPVPVAVATRGYHQTATARVTRVTCAFRGDESSRSTLERTAAICVAISAELRVATFAVRGRTMFPPEIGTDAEDMVLQAWLEQAGRAQDEALERLVKAGATPEQLSTVVGSGRSWASALDAVGWERDDVLVVGSSRESVLERLFLGSSAAKIVKHSPVPVIVVP